MYIKERDMLYIYVNLAQMTRVQLVQLLKGVTMTVSTVSTEIIKSQEERLGKEIPTQTFPKSNLPKLVGKLEAIGFVALPKDETTVWSDYRAPQALIVLQRTIEPVKGHPVLQKVTVYNKDGIKVSTNGDIKALLSEAGF
jgi:hypothetical protein